MTSSLPSSDPLANCWISYLQREPPGGDVAIEVRLGDLALLLRDEQRARFREILSAIHDHTETTYKRRDRERDFDDWSKPACLPFLRQIFELLNGEEGIRSLVQEYKDRCSRMLQQE